MEEKSTSYKSIFKATSIFGGVQVFNIIITLIRVKVIALLIGTVGMGLNGLLLSSLNLIRTFTSLGINESAVRDIAKAHNSDDSLHIRTTFQVFKRLVWLTAFFAFFLTIVFSPLLSKFSFNSSSYTSSYAWLSITFIFGALTGGVYTLLRGTRQIKYLAQANVFGGIIGLIVAIPIFYFYGIDGVVPAIIVTAFFNYLVSLYFKSKIQFEPIFVSWKDTYNIGKPIIQLGLSLTLVNLLAAIVSFVLNTFISKTGTLSDVGLYSAGNSIVEGYIGMVFTAIATDFFPRLSGVISNENRWKKIANEQAELILIILGIVLILLISSIPILIRVLLSKQFLASQDFITWAAIAIPLKGIVWVMGYIILAKGNNKLFLIVEVVSNLIVLFLNVIFYHFYGLKGLGVSLIISYLISSIVLILILKKKYQFQFSKNVFKLLLVNVSSLGLCQLSIYQLEFPYAQLLEFIIVIIVLSYNLYEFNKRINFKTIINSIKNKFK